MEVKPGYKKTEVGVIPEDWDTKSCSHLSSLITVGIVVRPTQYYREQGVPALRSANIREDGIDESEMVFISEESNRLLSKSQVKPGDVLTVRTGYPGTSATVPPHLAGANCIDILITRPSDKVCSGYLVSWINSPFGKSQVLRDQGGLAQQHFNVGDLRELVIALPPTKAEQEAIAEALSNADALIESLEQLIAKKRHLKQGVMQELLTGKRRLPGFNTDWESRTFEELFEFFGGLSASRDELSTTGHLYLHYGDIHTSSRAYVDLCSDTSEIPKLNVPIGGVNRGSLLEDGDVVFVDASEDDEGTSKHVVIFNPDRIPFIAGLHTIVAKGRDATLVPEYLRHCFQTAAIKAQFKFFAVGTKVSGVSKRSIRRITMTVPKPAEQTAIASVLSDMDIEIEALESRLAKARQIKQGMMQELLTGRIRLV